MAIGILLDFAGGTVEQYDAIMADMNLGGQTPPHAVLHFAGPAEGGWRVVDVWETQEAFDEFARTSIMPLTAKHGVTAEPKIQTWPVHNVLK
jgi:hypothetical protein